MVRSFGPYIRAFRKGPCSLWFADDHMLVVEPTTRQLPYDENYRRIMFRDIQAITLQPTSKFAAVNIIAGILLGLFLLVMMTSDVFSSDIDDYAVFAIMIGLPLLTLLTINLMKGPSCKVRLQTAVLLLEMEIFTRRRSAERVIQQILDRANRAQGVDPAAAPAPEAP